MVTSPYLTAREACAYLRIPSMSAFYTFKHRTKLRAYRRGGILLFKVSDLDAVLECDQPVQEPRRRLKAVR